MIRKILRPNSNNFTISIPDEYIKERHVHCKNYFGTIHKVTDDIWRNEVFRL
jgi:hypothetical protein